MAASKGGHDDRIGGNIRVMKYREAAEQRSGSASTANPWTIIVVPHNPVFAQAADRRIIGHRRL